MSTINYPRTAYFTELEHAPISDARIFILATDLQINSCVNESVACMAPIRNLANKWNRGEWGDFTILS